ncbi:TPA: hypothetical protein ACF2DD_002138 [Clostridium perfringens]
MKKYFVVFMAECNGNFPENDIVKFEEIKTKEDVNELEVFLEYKWFGDDRKLKVINFREI